MSRRSIIVTICVAISLTTVVIPVQAGEDNGTVTLEWLEHIAIRMDVTSITYPGASWDIQVTDGAPVNVYLMRSSQYEDYVDPLQAEFEYDEPNSMLNTTSFSKGPALPGYSVSYLVIESAAFSSMDTSTVEYEVEWFDDEDDEENYCFPVLAILLGVGGGAGVLLWWMRRGGGTTTGPRSDVAPAPVDDGSVELGPQPEPPDMR
jgi:hypothetical protein